MKNILIALGCCALLLQPAGVRPQDQTVKHGGKIETKYDGFNYETVARLRKMKVNCDGVKDKFNKDSCVSIEVSLHCPGVQLEAVHHVTLQIVFENKDWVHFHGPEQRHLSFVTDTETLRLGRMSLVNTNSPGSWNTKVETLEAKIPYATFKKIAMAQTAEMQVGKDVVELRDNNLAALRDLNSRVLGPPTKN